MAKAKEDEVKSGELVTVETGNTALANRRADADDHSGKEDIAAEDLKFARLVIAQGLSTQITPGNSDFIDGLRIGDMFNDLTGEIYGAGPLKFIPVQRAVRFIEFIPRSEGGGVRDLNVPRGDARTEWTTGPNGERQAPLATRFTEFVTLLVHSDGTTEPIVISIKETNKFQTRAAKALTSAIAFKEGPIYSGLYSVTSKLEKNASGTFGVFVVRQAGSLEMDDPLYVQAKQAYQKFHGKDIIVNREQGDVEPEGDTPF